jgi:WD40 repeat protein
MPRPTAHDRESEQALVAPVPTESDNTMSLGVRPLINLLAVGLLFLGGVSFAALGDEGRDKGDSRPKAKVDSDDEPLPKGAIRRLGTTRFRHADNITAISYSADGTLLVTASIERTVCVWDAKSGKKTSEFAVPREDRRDRGRLHAQFGGVLLPLHTPQNRRENARSVNKRPSDLQGFSARAMGAGHHQKFISVWMSSSRRLAPAPLPVSVCP